MPQDQNAATSIMKHRRLQLVVGIVGMVYGTASGAALKWFPDRSGLGAGLTAADLAQGQR